MSSLCLSTKDEYNRELEEVSGTSASEALNSEVCNSALKKRRRCRRRKNKLGRYDDSPSMTSCGNVSESSSEYSKRSLQRSIAQKKSRQANEATTLSLEERSQYLALDCEMVGVGPFGTKSTLARVTIVNWDGEIVYNQLIRPNEEVTDYRTFVSGITPSDFEDDEMVVDLETCRKKVLDILEGKILVGHALKNDLYALKIQHPWQQIRDTAKYEPFMKLRFEDGVYWPRKLKELVYQYLNGIEIQKAGEPHSAYEDAYSAMLLYQTVRVKWEKVMTYKVRKTAEIEHMKKLQQTDILLSCKGSKAMSTPDDGLVKTVASEGIWPSLVAPSVY